MYKIQWKHVITICFYIIIYKSYILLIHTCFWLPLFFCIFSEAEASMHIKVTFFMFVMVYLLTVFPLYFVAFCIYWQENTSLKNM